MEYNLPSEIVKDLNFGDKAKESSWFKSIQEIKNKYPKPE